MEKELEDIVDHDFDEDAINELSNPTLGAKCVLITVESFYRSDKSAAKKNGSFQKMGLSKPILSGILRLGFKLPTPIQRATIPIALTGKDVVAMARTGNDPLFILLLARKW